MEDNFVYTLIILVSKDNEADEYMRLLRLYHKSHPVEPVCAIVPLTPIPSPRSPVIIGLPTGAGSS